MYWIITALCSTSAVTLIALTTWLCITGKLAKPTKDTEPLKSSLIELTNSINQSFIDTSDYASKAQVEYLKENVDKINEAIENERNQLKVLDQQLNSTQSEVEDREIKIQELKGSKEEEAKLLLQISQEFELLNQEAENLQSNLSDSLSAIKSIEFEVELNQEQIEKFREFQNSVEQTMSRLKELTVEGQEVERRLKVLSQQYRSLEEEYTKLVEQQFA